MGFVERESHVWVHTQAHTNHKHTTAQSNTNGRPCSAVPSPLCCSLPAAAPRQILRAPTSMHCLNICIQGCHRLLQTRNAGWTARSPDTTVKPSLVITRRSAPAATLLIHLHPLPSPLPLPTASARTLLTTSAVAPTATLVRPAAPTIRASSNFATVSLMNTGSAAPRVLLAAVASFGRPTGILRR